MFALKSDLTPEGGRNSARLMFSPDGNALIASSGNDVQVWPRWLDGPPRPVVNSTGALERVTPNPDGSLVYLYRSGNSLTDVLTVATGNVTHSGLPKNCPSWAHFDTAGGFFLVSRGPDALVRYDYTPKLKKKVREAWVLERHSEDPQRRPLGSHYRFGAICGPVGRFVTLEYKAGGAEPFHGLTVRSVKDGAVVFHRALKSNEASKLLNRAGLALAVHPSGGYMAYPDGPEIRLRALSDAVKVRAKVPAPEPPAAKKPTAKKVTAKAKKKPEVHAVAFNPAGTLLAAVGDRGVVTLYDTKTWKVAGSFDWKIGKLRAVCFSADGTRAATMSGSGNIMVWDMEV